MSQDVQSLLNQRKEQWHRFQQLRDINPRDAKAARRVAIQVERELLDLGFTGLN